jgi:hypothetical protein
MLVHLQCDMNGVPTSGEIEYLTPWAPQVLALGAEDSLSYWKRVKEYENGWFSVCKVPCSGNMDFGIFIQLLGLEGWVLTWCRLPDLTLGAEGCIFAETFVWLCWTICLIISGFESQSLLVRISMSIAGSSIIFLGIGIECVGFYQRYSWCFNTQCYHEGSLRSRGSTFCVSVCQNFE